YEDQHGRFNYCGPSNLSMALTFWGWKGNRDVVGRAIKPENDDKNVMPYEMADFAETQAGLGSAVRVGGDLDLVKELVANGFPVILEKGTFLTDLAGEFSWMGHYQLVTGYDQAKQILIVQDTYIGPDHEMSYQDILDGWRAFDYLYIVIYPPDRETEVKAILGSRWDETTSEQTAAQVASEEVYTLSGRDQFFAWFNRGTSLMMLQDYAGAAQAYDQAFSVYPSIPEEERPWRMMWYQTGPYFAYFYSGRYYDVIDLATRTLANMSKPALEESFYWRGMAKAALGDTSGAIADYRASLKLHPDFEPSSYQLKLLGASP
ncbi:MAG TPA: tetratricopeptide repeat protein, partial [Anaerolineales bacterium]|nr:tetratricopeptide repeat protein [Anaerolineales bacterium]